MCFLQLKDVICLLRSEVARAGGQAAWAKKTGTNRTIINRVLNDRQPPSKQIIRALELRMVFMSKPKSPRDSKSVNVWNENKMLEGVQNYLERGRRHRVLSDAELDHLCVAE